METNNTNQFMQEDDSTTNQGFNGLANSGNWVPFTPPATLLLQPHEFSNLPILSTSEVYYSGVTNVPQELSDHGPLSSPSYSDSSTYYTQNSSQQTTSDDDEENTSSNPSSPTSLMQELHNQPFLMDSATGMQLSTPYILSTPTSSTIPTPYGNKIKVLLINLSKSKHIHGAYHGTIKPLKLKYPPLKENWNEVPVYVPREYRHCTNSNATACTCRATQEPQIPNNALIFSIEFFEVSKPYAPCQHKTTPCNLKGLPLVGLTTFNGSCQGPYVQFKTPSKKRDSWNFKLIVRCPVRPPFSMRLKLANGKYEFESEVIRISQKEKRQAKRPKPGAVPLSGELPSQISESPLDVESFAMLLQQRVTVDSKLQILLCLENFFSYKRQSNPTLEPKDIHIFRAYFGETNEANNVHNYFVSLWFI